MTQPQDRFFVTGIGHVPRAHTPASRCAGQVFGQTLPRGTVSQFEPSQICVTWQGISLSAGARHSTLRHAWSVAGVAVMRVSTLGARRRGLGIRLVGRGVGLLAHPQRYLVRLPARPMMVRMMSAWENVANPVPSLCFCLCSPARLLIDGREIFRGMN